MVSKEVRRRTVQVYLPGEAMKADWEDAADARGLSLSKWVQHVVQDQLHREEEGITTDRFERVRDELDQAREEIRQLEQTIEEKDALIERLEDDLTRWRNQAFADPDFAGTRRYASAVVETIRSWRNQHGDPKPIPEDKLLDEADIDATDPDAVQGVRDQLDHLMAADVVESTPRGWRWVE